MPGCERRGGGNRITMNAAGAALNIVVVATAAALGVGENAIAQPAGPMSIEIDATELPRKLLHAKLTIPLDGPLARNGGELALWYPKWIPGTHGPGGPVQNIGGLTMSDEDGAAIEWTRQPGEVYRINAQIPAESDSLIITIRYITDQSSTNSHGVDSFGSELLGFVSPNTVLFYPDGADVAQLEIRPSLILPDDWSAASALIEIEAESTSGDDDDDDPGRIEYETTTVETFVDSPVMLGRYMEPYDLVTEKLAETVPPHVMSIFSEAESVVEIPDDVKQLFVDMVTQAALLFDSHPFEHFDILVATTDEMGRNGLEHLASTFNVVGQRTLQSAKRLSGWDEYLIPHEYVHSWVGKYRRPAGMITTDYHTPKNTELLWVYEGLTQHLGEIINVRCGMTTPEEYRWSLQRAVRGHRLRQGRAWRALADTAAASHILRGGSRNWGSLRRGQDYYGEGAIIWLEADAIIRRLTDGDKSLDEFVRAFFKFREDQPVPLGFTRADIVDALNSVVEHDWNAFLRERIEEPTEHFASNVASELGYTIEYTNTAPEGPDGARYDELDMRDSIGASISGGGRIDEIILGSPADQTGLGPDMEIVGVGEFVWSRERMLDALAASAETGSIDLMLVSGDKYITKTIVYDGGPRYMILVRDDDDDDAPDPLEEILKPLEIPKE